MTKQAIFVESGRRGSEKRWANQACQNISLKGLTPEQAIFVREMVGDLRRAAEKVAA